MIRQGVTSLLVCRLASNAGGQDLRTGVRSAFAANPHALFIGPNIAAARNLFESFVGKNAAANQMPTPAVRWKQLDPLKSKFTLRHD